MITLGDHVGQADTFEFQVVAPQLGIAHPTGYPLFVGLGKLFSLLPVGSMAWRVNLSSAMFATIAVWLIYRAIVALTSDRLAAALAAIALAASPVFWSQAVVAEVYALNALFVAAILFLLIKLAADSIQPPGAASTQASNLYASLLPLRPRLLASPHQRDLDPGDCDHARARAASPVGEVVAGGGWIVRAGVDAVAVHLSALARVAQRAMADDRRVAELDSSGCALAAL